MTDYAKPDSLPFRSYYAQQRRKKRKAANALVQRYITSLSAAGGMYYQLSEPVVIGAGEDFEIEIPFVTSTDGLQMLIGTLNNKSCFFVDNAIGIIDLDGASLYTGSGSYDKGAVNILSVRRVNNTITLTPPNGNPVSSTNVNGNFDFRFIGQRSAGGNYFFTGEIYDLKIWTGGDRNTGTLILDIPIDEDWKTSTDLHDAQGNVIGSAINVTENEADLYTLIDNGTAWQSATRTIPIAGGA